MRRRKTSYSHFRSIDASISTSSVLGTGPWGDDIDSAHWQKGEGREVIGREGTEVQIHL